MLKDLGAADDAIAKALEKENAKQQGNLADRLAKRKARRKNKANEEFELKKDQAAEIAEAEAQVAEKEDDLRRGARREAFKARLAQM